MSQPLLLFVILFFASFTQSLTGFGLMMVAMPLLAGLIGVPAAAPLLSMLSIGVQIPLLVRYHSSLNLHDVVRLAGAALVGIPIGVWALGHVHPDIITRVLGVIIVGYALYALGTPSLPEMRTPGWAYGFGLMAGLLGGAYAIAAPPLIIYGDWNHWEPAEFKGNLQGIFMVTGLTQVVAHAIAGNFTPVVWQSLLPALPGLALGIVAGLSLDRTIDPQWFRRIVLVLLIAVGVQLLV